MKGILFRLRFILWMDETLNHLRNPAMIRFPGKYQQTMVPHRLKVVRNGCCASAATISWRGNPAICGGGLWFSQLHQLLRSDDVPRSGSRLTQGCLEIGEVRSAMTSRVLLLYHFFCVFFLVDSLGLRNPGCFLSEILGDKLTNFLLDFVGFCDSAALAHGSETFNGCDLD